MDERWRVAYVRRVLRSRWRRLRRRWSWSKSARATTRVVLHIVPPPARRRVPRLLRYAHGFQISAFAVEFARRRLPHGGNLLVFGAGNDTSTWSLVNAHGRTVILEDDPHWANVARRQGGVEVVLVEYPTTVATSWTCTDAADIRLPELPESILSTRWDVVVVDGPAGWGPQTPGRAAPIVLAAHLVAADGVVMIDDCFRDLEAKMRDLVFARPADLYLDLERPVAVYLISQDDRASARDDMVRGAIRGGVELCAIQVDDTAVYQDALRRIVGQPGPVGKEEFIRVTLRAKCTAGGPPCVAIEHRGELLGHATGPWTQAIASLVESWGSVAEACGFVVDGWRDDPDRAAYRLRLWMDTRQCYVREQLA